MSTVSTIRAALRLWYDANKRDLPWRHTSDPYRIWLSEVILQQTRVDQGLNYWLRFVDRFPTVQELADSDDDEVMKLWQGLGYYSRARNLLVTARMIRDRYDGEFPSTYTELLQLKGVGEYTAAAIGSIAFGLAEPVVDGNVYRVLSRLFGIATPIDSTEGKREFREIAHRVLDRNDPGQHNQAMMELGARVCSPRDPKCGLCPVSDHCIALRDQRISELPVKAGTTRIRIRHFNYFFIRKEEGFFLRKRIEKDIWQQLYELPLIETQGVANGSEMKRRLNGSIGDHSMKKSGSLTHILSHQRIEAQFWEVGPIGKFKVPADWIEVALEDMDRFAVPRLIDRWLKEMAPIRRSETADL